MIIERIVYCVVCIVLFGFICNKYFKTKSSIYLSLLAIQLVCMLTQLIAFFANIYVDIFMQLYILVFNIILPSCVFAAGYLNINIEELIEIKMGDFYAKKGSYDKAIEKYKKAISKNNNNAQTFAKLGRIYNAKGDRRTAFDKFARAIDINRNDYRSYYEIGVIFNDMGKQADAQIVLDNALRIKPDFTPASELLAVVLCAQNKYDEAINVYKNATRYDSDNYQLYYQMGVVRTELRDFTEAKECYEKAIELNPSLYQAYFSLGQINLLKGELDQAEKMFKKSLVSKELTAKSYYQLAKVYILNDEEIKAVTYLGYAIDIDSSYKYKAESEPLFAKIKDYITGLSMANRVMQQAEIIETLKNNEMIDEDDSVSAREEEIEEEITATSQENLENEDVINEEDKINDTENTSKKSESKFFQMMKSVLGFENSNDEESEEDNDSIEETEEIENSNEYVEQEKVRKEELYINEDNKYENKSYESDTLTNQSDNNSIKDNEAAEGVLSDFKEFNNEEKLDIFEKFKKLKMEEEEKAERLRRAQKIKQLEELRAQEEKKREPILSNKQNDEFTNDDDPIVVRVVSKNDNEDESKSKEKRLLENSIELLNKENLRKIETYEESDVANENFEDEDTMTEPHFDFMDRFKRR
ncbi:MAG: tetratricopeptide repeat protein [Clostridia bacterium]|nr:tetratricopeptide repeat protein [Clostridia bacterium]